MMMTAVEVDNMMLILHLSSLFEILKIFGRFSADLLSVSYDLAEYFDKRLIFGLDSATNG